MLINQQNRNILPLLCETLECGLDGAVVCFAVYHEEVLLGVWRVGNMLFTPIISNNSLGCEGRWGRTPTPARRMPVTES